MRLNKKWVLIGFFLFAIAAFVLSITLIVRGPEFGARMSAQTRARALKFSGFEQGRFENTPKQKDYDLVVNFKDMMGGQSRVPPSPFPRLKPVFKDPPEHGLRAIWLGHATVLIEIDGRRVITDPMLSNEAFPISFLAPKRQNPTPVNLEELPLIDIATISHDHYDHLDMKTVVKLAEKSVHFFVGLGVGEHLLKWGIPRRQVHQMAWGETIEYKGLRVHCTPARHYSGRRSMDNSTLWASFVVEGPKHKIFHSGDSGFGPHFRKIGERFGPIDIAFVKIGDYGLDEGWRDIHMVPEDSIRAGIDLRGRVFFPIHWGTFVLSNHDWNEPIIRTLRAAKKQGIPVVTPMLGETYDVAKEFVSRSWWKGLGAGKSRVAPD